MHSEDIKPSHYNPHRLFTGAFIPNWLLERGEISSGAKLCFARLIQYAGENGECWPAQATIAQALGLTVRQVRRLLAELAGARLIEVEAGHGRCSSTYRFLLHPWMNAAPRTPRQPAKNRRRKPPSGRPAPPAPGRPNRPTKTGENPPPGDALEGGHGWRPGADMNGAPGAPSMSGPIKEEENHGRESLNEDDAEKGNAAEPNLPPAVVAVVEWFPEEQRPRLAKMAAAKAKRFGPDRLVRNLEYALHRKPDDPARYCAKAIDQDYADGWSPPPKPKPPAPPRRPPPPEECFINQIDFAEARRKIRARRNSAGKGKANETPGKTRPAEKSGPCPAAAAGGEPGAGTH